jgi:hypothetical protein
MPFTRRTLAKHSTAHNKCSTSDSSTRKASMAYVLALLASENIMWYQFPATEANIEQSNILNPYKESCQ